MEPALARVWVLVTGAAPEQQRETVSALLWEMATASEVALKKGQEMELQ